MKKILTEAEINRFQQLAGIKPLYEQDDDKPVLKVGGGIDPEDIKKALNAAKETTCDIVDKIKNSNAWQKIEAEAQKEYESGGERIKASIKKLWDIIKKIASFLAKGIRSKNNRENIENIVDAGIGISIVHTIYDAIADIGVGWLDSMTSHAAWVGGLIALKVTVKILNILYWKGGKSKDENISEQFEDTCEPLLTDDEKEAILSSLGAEEIE